MKITKKFIFAFVFLSYFWIGSAEATFFSGNDIYTRLKDYKAEKTQNMPLASSAVGYVIGVVDVMNKRKDPSTSFMFCIPQEATASQLVDVAFDYLDKNPKDRHLSAWTLVEGAFTDAFPCK